MSSLVQLLEVENNAKYMQEKWGMEINVRNESRKGNKLIKV
jgi:hypothetical protein